MPISQDFIHTRGNATIDQVLRAYLTRNGEWWWLLVVEEKGEYFVCSFGSLLPYLLGRTPHIVHHIGNCPICMAMDPIFWTDTSALVESALADQKICQQIVSSLPMAELPVVDDPSESSDIVNTMMMRNARACGVRVDGVISGVFIFQVKGGLGEPPQF